MCIRDSGKRRSFLTERVRCTLTPPRNGLSLIHIWLTEFYAQFRAVAVNYNQVVKALHGNFSEKKALAFLYKLEKATTELAMLNRQVIDLTNECKELWLPK